MHAHQCQACKRVWFHSEEMKGNEAAHRCVCGAVQWQQFSPAAQELRVGNIALAQNQPESKLHTIAGALVDVAYIVLMGACLVIIGVTLYRAIKENQA